MSWLNKLYSAATGAPRAIKALASGDIKNFKLFDNQSIKESFKDKNAGYTLAITSVLGGLGIGNNEMSQLGNLGNPKTGLGGLSGGVSFGGESTKNTLLPFVVIAAVVITLITLFAIFKPKGRK